MSGYTITNLKSDVDDSAPRFGFAPDLEARFAREPLGSDVLGLSYQRLAPNFRMPFGHRHREQEEIYVVLGGSGRMKLDDDVVEVKQWDVVRVPPETTRSYEAGEDGMELLAFGAGASGLRDAEMAPGWWAD